MSVGICWAETLAGICGGRVTWTRAADDGHWGSRCSKCRAEGRAASGDAKKLDAREDAAAPTIEELRALTGNDTFETWRDPDDGAWCVGYSIGGDPHGYIVAEAFTEPAALIDADAFLRREAAAVEARP